MKNVSYKSVNMFELITCLTNAADLVSSALANHHQQVAYMAFKIAEKINLSKSEQKDLMLAGLLHDVGALSLAERLELLENEPVNSQDHGFKGAKLIERFKPLYNVAQIIKYHHMPWNHGEGKFYKGEKVPILSHIIHLADRITTSIDHSNRSTEQIENIKNKILERKGSIFVPEFVDAFISLAEYEYVWLDLSDKSLLQTIRDITEFDTMYLNIEEVIDLTKIFSNIIDFRSPFTANHTAGVAKTAEILARLVGFSENECKMMLVAGYLHDLGKLAIPNHILEKPGKLDKEEFNIIKSHPFYTYRLIKPIKEFETINIWAAFHHEKLNGKGYPFHLEAKDIPLGARIVAVADIFTAITEQRPYRKGMSKENVIKVFQSMVQDRAICPHVTSILIEQYDFINHIREEAQRQAAVEYNYFIKN